jgi:hypothetical protein
MCVDPPSQRFVFVRLRRDESGWQARDELRPTSNKGTLRAFRNADRFPTFKIFRRPGALRRRFAPGQSRRSDPIGRPQRPFSAYLKLEDGKVGFEFPEKTARASESRQANIS